MPTNSESAARSGKASVTSDDHPSLEELRAINQTYPEPLDLARLWLIALPPKKGSKK